MNEPAVLDGFLFVRHDLSRADQRNSAVMADLRLAGHLASQLLLYDTVIIPTRDYGILPALTKWMGARAFFEAVSQGGIRFVHIDSMLGYIGNGGALQTWIMGPGEREFEPHQKALFGSQTDAIDIQLGTPLLGLSRRRRRSALDLIHRASQAFECKALNYEERVAQETYRDVDKTQAYRDWVIEATGNRGGAVDLMRLPGIEANAVQLPVRTPVATPVELLLRVAEVNEEIVLADACGQCDLLTPLGGGELLRAKLERSGIEQENLASFSSLLELADVPNVADAVVRGAASVEELWDLRSTKASRDFRRWLREADAADAEDLKKAYVQALQGKAWVSSVPVKVLRFLLTTAADAVPVPFLGKALGVVDSFFVEKWLAGYAPQIHLNDLRRIIG